MRRTEFLESEKMPQKVIAAIPTPEQIAFSTPNKLAVKPIL